jgi:hypothetical protein
MFLNFGRYEIEISPLSGGGRFSYCAAINFDETGL